MRPITCRSEYPPPTATREHNGAYPRSITSTKNMTNLESQRSNKFTMSLSSLRFHFVAFLLTTCLFIPGAQSQQQTTLDIVLIIDESSSQEPTQAEIVNTIPVLFDVLNRLSGGDFRVGAVGYGNREGVLGQPSKIISLTNNPSAVINALDTELVADGIDEPGYQTIREIATNTLSLVKPSVTDGTLIEGAGGMPTFPQSEGFCLILITDGPNEGGDKTTKQEATDAILAASGKLFNVDPFLGVMDLSPGILYGDVAAASGGQSFLLADFLTNAELVFTTIAMECAASVFTKSPSAVPSSSLEPTRAVDTCTTADRFSCTPPPVVGKGKGGGKGARNIRRNLLVSGRNLKGKGKGGKGGKSQADLNTAGGGAHVPSSSLVCIEATRSKDGSSSFNTACVPNKDIQAYNMAYLLDNTNTLKQSKKSGKTGLGKGNQVAGCGCCEDLGFTEEDDSDGNTPSECLTTIIV